MPTNPSPTTWTLIFKHSTSSVLLHVAKDSTFTSIKSDLLSALRSAASNLDGRFLGQTIPDSAEDVLLARPIDSEDLAHGWTELEEEIDGEVDENEEEVMGKGKGKAKAKPKRKSGTGKDCPVGAGLRDGSILAFKFAGSEEADWNVTVPEYDYGDEEGEEEMVEG